ncbi:MAG: hypothetical protein AAFX65_08560 [Cyanobacteria bacterium J06638_7]
MQVLGAVVGTLGGVIVSLWGTAGLPRGSWMVLQGGRPDWTTFSRWDSGAAGRLLMRQLPLAVLLLVLISVAAIPALVAFAVPVYLLVNQTFLPWLALLEGEGPLANLQRGRQVVDPQWWLVLLLVQGAIVLAGALLCGVGLLAAAPLSLCVASAAYRQLFGGEDRTGLLKPAGW